MRGVMAAMMRAESDPADMTRAPSAETEIEWLPLCRPPLDLNGPTAVPFTPLEPADEELAQVRDTFGLHELAVEGIKPPGGWGSSCTSRTSAPPTRG